MKAPHTGLLGRLPARLRNAVFAPLRPLVLKHFPKPLNDMRSSFGLPRLNDLRHHFCAGTYCAYLDLPELTPLPRMPRGHFFLGPLTWRPREAPPSLENLPADRRLVYVTMGSSGDNRVLPGVLRATMAAGFSVALSGVSETDAIALCRSVRGLSGRFVSSRCFDPRPILNRAALTICHGGSGTVYQSLEHGVPVLCIPDNPDQEMVAAHVLAAGAGAVVSPDSVDDRRMNEGLATALNCTKTAQHFGDVLEAWDTRAHWLNWLGAFAARHRHRRKAARLS
jgi:UDP:flavonoid glycosyltransferase YjiC (YdhE family)